MSWQSSNSFDKHQVGKVFRTEIFLMWVGMKQSRKSVSWPTFWILKNSSTEPELAEMVSWFVFGETKRRKYSNYFLGDFAVGRRSFIKSEMGAFSLMWFCDLDNPLLINKELKEMFFEANYRSIVTFFLKIFQKV